MTKPTRIHYDIQAKSAPQMPKCMPKMLSVTAENVPNHMKTAILNSLFPALGSLMYGVTFRNPGSFLARNAFQVPNDCHTVFYDIIRSQKDIREYYASGWGSLPTAAFCIKTVKSRFFVNLLLTND